MDKCYTEPYGVLLKVVGKDRLLNTGLTGFVDTSAKVTTIGQATPLDQNQLLKELDNVLWYIISIYVATGSDLPKVANKIYAVLNELNCSLVPPTEGK